MSAYSELTRGQNRVPMVPSNEDYERADALMRQHRVEVRSRKTGAFGIKEANAVLAKVIKGVVPNASPELVQALFDRGADICIERRKSNSLIKRLTGQDQEDVLSNLLKQATQSSTEEILIILAQNADERCLNEALPVAIRQGDTNKASILLARGADASSLCTLFLEVVQSGPDDMVKTLLRDVGGACQTCRNNGLTQAAISGHEAKVQALLKNGADATADGLAAILGASRTVKEEIAVEIVSSGGKNIKPTLLDKMLGQAYGRKQYQLVEQCLREGARGVQTNDALIMAVENRQVRLVQKILRCQPHESTLADAMARTAKLGDLRVAREMINLLLSAGLRGNSVSEMLIKVVDKTSMPGDDGVRLQVLQLLLTKGVADVNLHEGRCISATISGGCAEMLPVLLRYRPSLMSLNAGLEAAMDLPTLSQRQNAVGVILKAGTVLGRGNDQSLLCAAISAASKRLLLNDVWALAELAKSNTACLAGFTAAISNGDQWLTPDGLAMVKVLLDCGASGDVVDDALCRAAVQFQRDAVELLAFSASPKALDTALEHVIGLSSDWRSPEAFWLLQFILELGLELKSDIGSANWALLYAVHAYTEGSASEDLVDLLLTVGAHADVNFRNGEALKIAARAWHAPLLEKLTSSGAGKEAMTEAFHTTITEPLAEDKAIDLLDVLFKCDTGAEIRCDVKATLQSGFPPIAACLSAHPQSTKLLKRLIDLGCELETEFQWTLCTEHEIGQEATTPLLWAMCQEKIATELIEALIDAKANVNFVAPVSKSTPLIIAVRYGRKDIVRRLIAAKANVIDRDVFDRSALFYASGFGDSASAKELLIAKSRENEGSLHEAARNLHSKVVALLIRGRHDVNFPSGRHQGRTALQELVYKCDGTASSIRLEETMLALMKGKADVLASHNCTGKNALFLALENPHPYAVTQALLDTSMWRYMTNDKNIFTIEAPETGTKYSYSPTTHITKGHYKGDIRQGKMLLQLLREKGCPDRYFAQSGPQPSDAVGMPDKIREAEERRQNEERRMKRDREREERPQRGRKAAPSKNNLV